MSHPEQQAAYLGGDPAAVEHMASCAACAPDRATLDEMRTLLDEPDLWVEPPRDLEDRVVTAAHAERPPMAVVVSLAERRRFSRAALLISATAACLLGALAGIVIALFSNRDPDADAAFALSSPQGAPPASARADVRSTNSGFEIKLKARGLPRTSLGQYYEAWVKNDAGTLVPVGTFHTGANTVTLWSGVSLERYPILTVTLEDEDGNQASSGRVLLTGRLQ